MKVVSKSSSWPGEERKCWAEGQGGRGEGLV